MSQFLNQPPPYSQIIDVPREETVSLLAKVLGIVSIGFLVTAVGVATSPAWAMLPGFIAVLALIFAVRGAQNANPVLALGLFYLLTYFMGWEIGPLVHRYIATLGTGIVIEAAATTGLAMAAMGIVAYLFQINYRKWTMVGVAALLCLILVGIASIFLRGLIQPGLYAWLTLGVFTILTIADFARIRAGGGDMPAVHLALSIYLDAINIFIALLQLLGGRRRN